MPGKLAGAPIARPRASVHALACLTALLAGAAPAHARAVATSSATPEERVVLPDDVVPRRYDIEIRPDAPHLTFTGSVRIRIEVRRPASRVTLNARDLTIDRVALDRQRAAPKIERDAERQQLTLRLRAPLPPGEYTLSIDYGGRINQQAAGLFALDYETPAGRQRALYTQFETGDARRFVPCWDQPDRKAVFALSAVVPSNLSAISNMPVASSAALPKGLKRVSFARSARMSSYLLFFALGDFERAHRHVSGVDVGVIVRRGDLAAADFALRSATEILPYYNDYFGARYPLAKLDLIAAPTGPSFGAMENWGAILFDDQDMLFDPRVSAEADRQHVYETVAHEIAHQWFGNLVTMAWWDELWLNEGFATWMSHKVIDRLHPEWKIWLRNDPDRRAAMTEDAGAGTHPIVTPIRDVAQADAAFDAIAYDKAAAVIRMMEAYVGEDAFRDGVRAYMARYARSNTVSADLWRELESTSQAPIGAIAGDFTSQAGVPMIDVNEADGSVTLSQDRFGIDPASREARTWRVPVVATPAVATPAASPAAGADRDARRLIVSGPQRVALPNAPAWLVNAGQTGYFVSRYSPELLRRLLDRIPQLSAEDQLGLFGDTAALASAGYSPMASLLDLVAVVPVDTDPAVWSRVCDELVTLGRHYEEGARAQAYRRWVRAELAPVLARVGWDRHAGESDSTTALRPALLKALAEADDQAVITEARNRFDRFEQSAQTLAGDVRSAVLSIVALHADAAAWERLHAIAQGQKAALERDQAYQILGGTRDPVLARRALELALSAETPRTSAPDLLRAVSVRHASDAFDFVVSHWARIAPLLVPQYSSGFAPRIAAASDDPATTARLSEFAGRVGRSCDPGEVRRAIASIRYRASIKQQRLAEIDRWLGDRS